MVYGTRTAAPLIGAIALATLLLTYPASAAFEVSWPDARSAAMLDRGTLVSRVLGPSGIPGEVVRGNTVEGSAGNTGRVTFAGGELFGLREAAGGAAVAEVRLGGVAVGLAATRLGGVLYEETCLGAGTAWSPEPEMWLALAVRCAGIRARDVDDLWSAALDAGVSRRILGRIVVSASGENLAHADIGGSPMTSRTLLGAALELDSAELSFSVSLESGFAPAVTTGFETSASDWFRLRAGAGNSPGRLGIGFGVGRRPSGWRPVVDAAWQWHPRLGVSSFVSITFEM